MKKRLIGAGVTTALALSMLGGSALAAPPGNESWDETNAQANVTGNSSLTGDFSAWIYVHNGPGHPDLHIQIYIDGEDYSCALDDADGDGVDIGSGSGGDDWSTTLHVLVDSDNTDCGDRIRFEGTWTYDTRRVRSHTNGTGWQERSTRHVDESPLADVRLRSNTDTLYDDVAGDAYYDRAKVRRHITGTPGNPNK